MKNYFLLLAFSFIANYGLCQNSNSGNTNTPKATFIVEINDQEYIVNEGEELKVESTTVKVRMAEYKKFDNGAISFNYPNNFSYEYEEDFGYRNWTLDGNMFVIMFFEMDEKTTLDDIVYGMTNQFGKQNCTVKPTEMSLGNKQLKGKKLAVSLAGQRLAYDIFEIKLSDSKSRFVTFQDVLNEDGSNSEESKKTIQKLDQSITYQ